MTHHEQFAIQSLIKDGGDCKTMTKQEEKRVRLLRSYSKYNASHREERKQHNRVYSKLEHVKARRREVYRLAKVSQEPVIDIITNVETIES